MKKFVLSDMHIGHEQAQYDIMDQAINYIRQNARPGDQIWGLGDWFHILESGFETCMRHSMTQKFRDLAGEIPTRLIPGNHDQELVKYRDDPGLGNPISPITLIKPFAENGFWYCHGHEFDPSVEYLPKWIIWLWNKLHSRPTLSKIKGDSITEKYLMAVFLVYLRASISLQNKGREENQHYKGIILGHTHLPIFQESPEIPFLLDDGDMRHNGTFVIEDETGFHLMQWMRNENRWQETFIKRP